MPSKKHRPEEIIGKLRGAAAVPADTFVRPHSPVIGPKKAPVTIVEFFGPSCKACRAFYPAVKQILATYPKDARLVMRYLPLQRSSFSRRRASRGFWSP